MADPKDEAQRIIHLMALCALADGDIDPREAEAIPRIAEEHGLLRVLGEVHIEQAFLDRVDELGVPALVRELAAGLIAPRARQEAIACVGEVVVADEELNDRELVVIELLQKEFGITNESVRRLLVPK